MSKRLNKLYGGIDKMLTNNYALYIFAFLSFVDIWNNLKNNDVQALFVFLVSAYITSIFSKNLTVIFIISLVVSNIYKGVTEGFDNGEAPPDGTIEQENELEAFAVDAEKLADQAEKQDEEEDAAEDSDDDDDEDQAKVENYQTKNNGGKVSKEQVKDAKELANVQGQLLNNLKEMTPLIQKVEGFADKYKDNISNDNIEKLIQVFTDNKK